MILIPMKVSFTFLSLFMEKNPKLTTKYKTPNNQPNQPQTAHHTVLSTLSISCSFGFIDALKT